MKTLGQRFNEKVTLLVPLFESDMKVGQKVNSYRDIEERMKKHGEFVEGMAFTIISILENEDA